MIKYWHALWHGNAKTKLCLWMIIILFLAALFLFFMAFLEKAGYYGIAGFLLLIFDLVLSQTISFSDTKYNAKGKKVAGRKKKSKKDADEEEEEPDEIMRKQQAFASYDEKQLKRLLKKNGSNKQHKTVMIDRWKEKNVIQCPAYIWVDKGLFYLLILEEEVRRFSIPVRKIQAVYYDKAVTANVLEDYQTIPEGSLMHMVFAPYFPTTFDRNRGGLITTHKNLYMIEPGIRFTNTSAKNLFEICDVEFKVEDEVTRSGKFDTYFIEVYKCQILLKDQVIEVSEYKERIQKILSQMAEAQIAGEVLIKSLKQMLKYHMISEEYAMETMNYARKLRSNSESES